MIKATIFILAVCASSFAYVFFMSSYVISKQCADLAYEQGTEQHIDCVNRLRTRKFD